MVYFGLPPLWPKTIGYIINAVYLLPLMHPWIYY